MDDLSQSELLVLKEIVLTGQTSNKALIYTLIEQEMIVNSGPGGLRLTHKGRSLLVRGSPALWDMAA